MRMLTFSFLKKCKLKGLLYHYPRQLSNGTTLAEENSTQILGDPSLVVAAPSWAEHEEPALRAAVLRDMCVVPDFISEQEEAALLDELDPYLKKLRYEFDHWDNAIQGYRETERRQWRPHNGAVLDRVRAAAFAATRRGPLPHAHVLDLAATGHIKPHVDAVRFCGGVIAGVCLASSAVMRLRHCTHSRLCVDALLQRRSLYVMRGVARYEFTHEVMGSKDSVWRGAALPRARRVALILREQPDPLAAERTAPDRTTPDRTTDHPTNG